MIQTPRRYRRLAPYIVTEVKVNGIVSGRDNKDKILLGTMTGSTAELSNYMAYTSPHYRSASATPSAPVVFPPVYTPYERTDVILTWGNAQACFTCTKDVAARTFSQLSIIEMNDSMRLFFEVPDGVRLDFPYASMTATLEYTSSEGEEKLSLNIYFMVDHVVSFKVQARKVMGLNWA